ncbi:GerAB/ArcD/ProY family transporter [Paenibacillus lactis]|uniref:GerAB/ArcD/ProY family transporter n=1 Tax=Paenibacillus lactis TaxID=228574 RepID=UPI0004901391|nr:GerAB/ArcD/ProY family transporter [Paenibacillus lactis]MCM3492968.1 GerAB/ArcD/ProY family transporter [Paenibacillus lactis]
MVNKTPWQLFRFAFVYLNAIPTGFLVTPLLWGSAYLGWMAILIGWGANLILLWFTVKVGRWDPDRSWIDFGQDLLGKWIHYPIILLILFWSVNYIGLDIEGFTLFFDTNYMRETPQWFIILIVGLVVTLTARWGMETLVYISDGLFIVIVLTILLMNMFFFQDADFNMVPAMYRHHNYGDVFKDSLTTLAYIAEWVVFLFLAPYLQIDRKAFRNLAAASAMVALGVLLQWASSLLSFGPYIGRELQYPLVELLRAGRGFLGNSDPFMIGLWSSSMFLHSAFLIHISVRCLAKLLALKEMDATLIAVIGGTGSILAFQYSKNPVLFQQDFSSSSMIAFFLLVECIPILYWIASLFRRGRRQRRNAA